MTVNVHRGADSLISIRVTDAKGKPYDLTDYSLITVDLPDQVQGSFSIDSAEIPAETAMADLDNITFTADTEGAIGNSILLVFNGIDDVDTIVANWNTTNPLNTVSHSGVGDEVIASQSLDLYGGVDAYSKIVNIDERLGEFDLKLITTDSNRLKVGPNQAMVVHVDKNGVHPNSDRVTVVNVDALNVKPNPF